MTYFTRSPPAKWCLGCMYPSFPSISLFMHNKILAQKILRNIRYETRKKNAARAVWPWFHSTTEAKFVKPWLKCSGPTFVAITNSCSLLLDFICCFHELFLLLTWFHWESIQLWNSITLTRTRFQGDEQRQGRRRVSGERGGKGEAMAKQNKWELFSLGMSSYMWFSR